MALDGQFWKSLPYQAPWEVLGVQWGFTNIPPGDHLPLNSGVPVSHTNIKLNSVTSAFVARLWMLRRKPHESHTFASSHLTAQSFPAPESKPVGVGVFRPLSHTLLDKFRFTGPAGPLNKSEVCMYVCVGGRRGDKLVNVAASPKICPWNRSPASLIWVPNYLLSLLFQPF